MRMLDLLAIRGEPFFPRTDHGCAGTRAVLLSFCMRFQICLDTYSVIQPAYEPVLKGKC